MDFSLKNGSNEICKRQETSVQTKLLLNPELSKLPPLADVHNLRSRAFIPRTSRQLPGQYYRLLY